MSVASTCSTLAGRSVYVSSAESDATGRRSAGGGRRRPADRLEEQVCAPGVVPLVRQVRPEQVAEIGARSTRLALQLHPRLGHRLAALAVVAPAAGGDEVLPLVAPSAVLGHDVVDRQVAARRAAVLAG